MYFSCEATHLMVVAPHSTVGETLQNIQVYPPLHQSDDLHHSPQLTSLNSTFFLSFFGSRSQTVLQYRICYESAGNIKSCLIILFCEKQKPNPAAAVTPPQLQPQPQPLNHEQQKSATSQWRFAQNNNFPHTSRCDAPLPPPSRHLGALSLCDDT